LQTTRDLALDLRPAMLDDLGLAAALRWYADRFAKRTQLEMHLAVEEIPDLPPALATASFRVAQEALTNVARHASAKNVWLEVRRMSRGLELVVRDDGVGFDVGAARDRATQGASLGLLGMEERVALTGGSIDIHSTAGTGTEILVRFPTRSGP
jgi:signal transduction histidine kinase